MQTEDFDFCNHELDMAEALEIIENYAHFEPFNIQYTKVLSTGSP